MDTSDRATYAVWYVGTVNVSYNIRGKLDKK